MALLAAAGFMGTALATVASGSANLEIAGLFSSDEELSGHIVLHMLRAGTLSPSHFFSYGALYHELCALALLPWQLLGGVSEREVVLGMRAVALAGGVATVLLAYLLGARIAGRWGGALAAAVVATGGELAKWGVTAHPDTVQVALLAAGLYAAVRRAEGGDRRWLIASALLAGLAFSTKYAGVFLLPIIVAADFFVVGRSRRWRELALDTAAVGAVFAVVFVVTNPYALVEWRRLLTQVREESDLAQAGHVFRAGGGALDWLRVVGGGGLAGPLTALLAGAGLVAALWTARRGKGRNGPPAGYWTVTGFAALYLGYLMVDTNFRVGRYALPLVPALAALGAWTAVRGARWLWREADGRAVVGRAAVAAVGLLALALAVLPGALATADVVRLRDGRMDEPAVRATLEAGAWLEAHAEPAARVLYDQYSYVPPRFTHRLATFGLTRAQVEAFRPDIIVTDEAIRGRFRDPAAASSYVDGPQAYGERALAYRLLEQGELSCFVVAARFGPVTIYARELPGCVRAS